MSGHCPGCGTYHEEDDDRMCAKCRPPQAEVVASSRPEVPPSPEYFVVMNYCRNRWWAEVGSNPNWAHTEYENKDGPKRLIRIPSEKDSPCSDVSQGGGGASSVVSASTSVTTTVSDSLLVPTTATTATTTTVKNGCEIPESASVAASTSKPPAWATPAILAACKPGERLYCSEGSGMIRAYPSKLAFDYLGKPDGFTVCDEAERKEEDDESYTVPPPACKPEPKDGAEEVADDLVSEWACELPNGSRPGGLDTRRLVTRIVAAIRADRAARPDIDKVRELCELTIQLTDRDRVIHVMAREVLAQLEAK